MNGRRIWRYIEDTDVWIYEYTHLAKKHKTGAKVRMLNIYRAAYYAVYKRRGK